MNMSTPPGDLRDQFWELRKPEYFNMPKECFIEQPHVTEEVHSVFLETLRRSMEQPRTQHWFHTYEIDYDETRVRKPKPRIPKLVGFPDTLRARYDPNMMLLLPSMTTNEELYPVSYFSLLYRYSNPYYNSLC
ncbi:uncharacterized protein LOC143605943 [Bidens hawaiensis]|uniref:uncharacterized protein LOC143605943 n=1 Tax=Bidens hawaiensis TaxID=980011 RepID=UPI004049E51C